MRRRTVVTAMGTLSSISVAGCLGSALSGSDQGPTEIGTLGGVPQTGTWSQVGYDARNTPHVREGRGPRTNPTVEWRALGDRPVYPPVVDDDLYLAEAWTDGTVLALASEDGGSIWSANRVPSIKWAPALADGCVCVLTVSETDGVRLHALDLETGNERWVRAEGITAPGETLTHAGPTVHGGRLYVPSDRGVIACDATTGDVDWSATLAPDRVTTEDGARRDTFWTTPAVSGDLVYTYDVNKLYGQTRTVYALGREAGDERWTGSLEVDDGWRFLHRPVVGRDRVFVSVGLPDAWQSYDDDEWEGAERLIALDAETGDVDWTWNLSRLTQTPPAYAEGAFYLGGWYPDADTGRLHALDPTDASVDWTYETEAGAVESPTVAGDTVYVAEGEQLGAVAVEDRSRRWRLDVGEKTGSLVVVGDSLYLRTNPHREDDSRILAVRPG